MLVLTGERYSTARGEKGSDCGCIWGVDWTEFTVGLDEKETSQR